MAGRDIRRLVARAAMNTGPVKRLALDRIAAGIEAAGAHIIVADDQEGLGRWLVQAHPRADLLETPGIFGPSLTTAWVRGLEAAGVRVLIAVGGDGTQRVVAQAQPSVPLLPVAGGTNNVVCWVGDETAAGLAAGRVAQGSPSLARQAKLIHVEAGGDTAIALVDVAHVRLPYLGAQAVWGAETVASLCLTLADPVRPGLSNPGGQVDPVDALDDWALVLDLADPDHIGVEAVDAVVAPGLMARFGVAHRGRLPVGQGLTWRLPEASTVALDGERELTVPPGDPVRLMVRRDGPFILNPGRILRAASHRAQG